MTAAASTSPQTSSAGPPRPRAVRLVAVRGGRPLGAILASCGLLAGALVLLLHLDRLPFPVCLFKQITGLPCLSCGGTRALGQLALFHVEAALRVNPLAMLVSVSVLAWGAADAALLPSGRALGLELSAPARRVARVAALGLLLANWVYLVVAGV